jgi:hypothetical protein
MVEERMKVGFCIDGLTHKLFSGNRYNEGLRLHSRRTGNQQEQRLPLDIKETCAFVDKGVLHKHASFAQISS